jgi:MinD superfamily P-loop ATPase
VKAVLVKIDQEAPNTGFYFGVIGLGEEDRVTGLVPEIDPLTGTVTFRLAEEGESAFEEPE